MLTALNIVYDIAERRGRLRRAVVCLVVGVSGIALLFVALALFALPPVLARGHVQLGRALLWLRWPGLALVFTGGLGVLFRFAVSRDPGQWWSAAIGAVVATVVWIAASYGVTVYAGFAGSFGQLYGCWVPSWWRCCGSMSAPWRFWPGPRSMPSWPTGPVDGRPAR